jgi:hypothetical protein
MHVGLPALIRSIWDDMELDRWSGPEEWEKKPFFICGCGDEDCRAYSIRSRLIQEAGRERIIRWTLLEERQGRTPREQETWEIPWPLSAEAVIRTAEETLHYARTLPLGTELSIHFGLVELLLEQAKQYKANMVDDYNE